MLGINKNLKVVKGKSSSSNHNANIKRQIKGVMKTNLNSSNLNVARSSKVLNRGQQRVETVNVSTSNIRNSSSSIPKARPSSKSTSSHNTYSSSVSSSNVNSSRSTSIVSIKKNGFDSNFVNNMAKSYNENTSTSKGHQIYNNNVNKVSDLADINKDYKDGFFTKLTSGPNGDISYSKVINEDGIRKYYSSNGILLKEVLSNGSVHFPSYGKYYDINKDGSLTYRDVFIKDGTSETKMNSTTYYPNGSVLEKNRSDSGELKVILTNPNRKDTYSYGRDSSGKTLYEDLLLPNNLRVKTTLGKYSLSKGMNRLSDGTGYDILSDGTVNMLNDNRKTVYSYKPDGSSVSTEYYSNGREKSVLNSDGTGKQFYENGTIEKEIFSDDSYKNYNKNGKLIEDHVSNDNVKCYNDDGHMTKNIVDGNLLYDEYDSGQVKFDVVNNTKFSFEEDGTISSINGTSGSYITGMKLRNNGENVEIYDPNSGAIVKNIYKDGSMDEYNYQNDMRGYTLYRADGSKEQYYDGKIVSNTVVSNNIESTYAYNPDGSKYLNAVKDLSNNSGTFYRQDGSVYSKQYGDNAEFYDTQGRLYAFKEGNIKKTYTFKSDGSQYVSNVLDYSTNENINYDEFGNVI